MGLVFDKNKTYFLVISRGHEELVFTAHNVEIVGALVTFIDKFGQQLIFAADCIVEAKEVEMK